METNQTIAVLSALAHESRLAIFRALVQAGPSGLPAGQIAALLDVPPSSLSFHLKELTHAQLVTSRQEGRFVIYCANYATMNGLLAYLTENCCGGNPCSPVSACSPSGNAASCNDQP
ncbi:ArsR/SmtB family transcription factor [Burkholderia pseudomultivorans]|uniref:ArsR family transcriptional regulator n=1 Tax=Burkholderia pseudomultivorans TaxID=1207504 RepID=A0A132F6R6_9BURK|nr:metalloregulator ArsR/SmtB family transcription factor [Burkholderia pseudomultivorans]KWF71308.1 ArsR family transcriptional regulator [Burkholderia pseudomultivorans]